MIKKKSVKKQNNGSGTGAILESLRSDFKVFGEALMGVKEKGDATFEAVGKLQEDVSALKEDMVIVKDELGLIRNELKAKVGRDEFNLLEKRVINLEKVVKIGRN